MKTLSIGAKDRKAELSKIVFGTTHCGTEISDLTTFEMLDTYYEMGGRTIDTARVYGQSEDSGQGKSELIVGKWLKTRGLRKEITLITKGCHPKLGDMSASRLTPECLKNDFYGSLECLGVDYVDVYFLHRDDTSLHVGQIIDALSKLVDAGKIRVLGASNWSLDRILEANAYALKNGKAPFSVSQIQWSLAETTQDLWGDSTLVYMNGSLRERYIKEGVPVMAFSSQAKGLFSKYLANPDTAVNEKTKRFFTSQNMKKIDAVKKICAITGKSPAAVVTSYITSHRINAAAIIGCSNVSQLRDSMSGVDLDLTPDMIKELEA